MPKGGFKVDGKHESKLSSSIPSTHASNWVNGEKNFAVFACMLAKRALFARANMFDWPFAGLRKM